MWVFWSAVRNYGMCFDCNIGSVGPLLHILIVYVSVTLVLRSQEEREQRRCRLAAVQEKRQCLETEVKELAAQSRRHASDLNAIRAKLKHLIEQRDTIIGYCIFCHID